jgi:hypothetical protein
MKLFFDKLKQLKSKNDKVYDELITLWVDLSTEKREEIIKKHVKSLDLNIKKTNNYFKKYNICI